MGSRYGDDNKNTNAMTQMVGRKVEEIHIDTAGVKFKTDQGNIGYYTEGDCCSYSYFAEALGLSNLRGQVVLKAEEIAMPDTNVPESAGAECTMVYGVKLTTKRGYTDFIYRNESNGYYGGWIELMSEGMELDSKDQELGDEWTM